MGISAHLHCDIFLPLKLSIDQKLNDKCTAAYYIIFQVCIAKSTSINVWEQRMVGAFEGGLRDAAVTVNCKQQFYAWNVSICSGRWYLL